MCVCVCVCVCVRVHVHVHVHAHSHVCLCGSESAAFHDFAICNPFVHRSEKVDPPPKYNEIDGKVDRRSFNGKYEVVGGVPR